MTPRSPWLLLALALNGCGEPRISDLDIEPAPQGLSIESTCYRVEGLGTNIILSIVALSFPSGCDAQARLFMSQAAALTAYREHKDKEVLRTTMRDALAQMPEHYDSLNLRFYGAPEDVEGIFDIEQSQIQVTTCSHSRFENPECESATEGEVQLSLPATGIDTTYMQHHFHSERNPRLEAADAQLTQAIIEHVGSL